MRRSSLYIRTVSNEKYRFGGNVAYSVVNFALIFSDVLLIRVLDVQIRSFVDKRGGVSAGELRARANFLPRDILVSYRAAVHFAQQFRFDSRRIHYARRRGAFNFCRVWKTCALRTDTLKHSKCNFNCGDRAFEIC